MGFSRHDSGSTASRDRLGRGIGGWGLKVKRRRVADEWANHGGEVGDSFPTCHRLSLPIRVGPSETRSQEAPEQYYFVVHGE